MRKKKVNKKVLILGGAGFIGHNLALQLKKIKYDVYVLDFLKINNLKSIKKSKYYPNPKLSRQIVLERLRLLKINKIKLIIQNLNDLSKLKKVFNKIKPDIIFHLAAVSHANKSNENPDESFQSNLVTLHNALVCSSKYKIDRFVYISSSMVYGNFKSKSVNEDSICKPIGMYGNYKISGENITKAFNHVYKLPYTIVRPSALYGERCISRRVGQIFIENAITNKSIEIKANTNEKLDFTYIKDFIDGLQKIISKKSSICETFNITYGNAKKITDLILILKKHFPNLKIVLKKRDKLMPKRGTLSISKAKKKLNFKPNWPLNAGYNEDIKWYKNFYKKNV